MRINRLVDTFTRGNKSAFSRKLKISPQSLHNYISGERKPGNQFLTKLSTLGVNSEWMLTGSGQMINFDKLTPDAPWKRLIILRHRIQQNRGTPRLWAESLGVSLEQYQKWEHNQEDIPPEVMDAIYEQVKEWIRKEWWYEGKGDIYINDPLKNYSPPDSYPPPEDGVTHIPLDEIEPTKPDVTKKTIAKLQPYTPQEEVEQLVHAIWKAAPNAEIRAFAHFLMLNLNKLGIPINPPSEKK